MKYFMLVFEDNWSDEMVVHGISLIDENKYDDIQEKISYLKTVEDFDVELYFGTNESNEYDSFEEYFSCFRFEEISESAFLELNKVKLPAGQVNPVECLDPIVLLS